MGCAFKRLGFGEVLRGEFLGLVLWEGFWSPPLIFSKKFLAWRVVVRIGGILGVFLDWALLRRANYEFDTRGEGYLGVSSVVAHLTLFFRRVVEPVC